MPPCTQCMSPRAYSNRPTRSRMSCGLGRGLMQGVSGETSQSWRDWHECGSGQSTILLIHRHPSPDRHRPGPPTYAPITATRPFGCISCLPRNTCRTTRPPRLSRWHMRTRPWPSCAASAVTVAPEDPEAFELTVRCNRYDVEWHSEPDWDMCQPLRYKHRRPRRIPVPNHPPAQGYGVGLVLPDSENARAEAARRAAIARNSLLDARGERQRAGGTCPVERPGGCRSGFRRRVSRGGAPLAW